MAALKCKVSISTYHEIAAILEKEGRKINESQGVLQLEKDDTLLSPIDFRLATIRRDTADIASKTYQSLVPNETGEYIKNPQSFVEYAKELYVFILDHP